MTADLLPPPPLPGQRFRLERFLSTVQVIHDISEFRRVVVTEFALPYAPQSAAWWRERIAEEMAEYLRQYGRTKKAAPQGTAVAGGVPS